MASVYPNPNPEDPWGLVSSVPGENGSRARRVGQVWLSGLVVLAVLGGAGQALAQPCDQAQIRGHLEAMVDTSGWQQAMAAIQACGAQAIPGLVTALNQGDRDLRLEAIAALEGLLALPTATAAWVDGTPALTETLITRLQTDPDEQVQERSAAVLGTVARLSGQASRQGAIAQALISPLTQTKAPLPLTITAAYALGQVRGEAAVVDPVLIALLKDPQSDFELRSAAARALADRGQPDPLVAILQDGAAGEAEKLPVAQGLRGLRLPTPAVVEALVAQIQGNGGELAVEASTALRTIAANAPAETSPLLLPHLDILVSQLQQSDPTILRNTVELLAVASATLGQPGPGLIAPGSPSPRQKSAYLESLNQGLANLEQNPQATAELQRQLHQAIAASQAGHSSLEGVLAKVVRTGTTTLLLHGLFWLGLVALYPRSPQVQALFFWNPRVRKIFGLGYVGLALTWTPFLRTKLFAPFRANLLAEANLEEADLQQYFPGSDVVVQGSGQRLPLMAALPDLKGQIVLEGESGLGKTMALKQLVKRSRRLVVYLPARKCAGGVIEALRDRLHGPAQDTDFLQSLIYSGALDLCIDGLNEVTPDTRAKITLFAETYFKGNILMATQPMDWVPPASARVYQLQPLTESQIGDFLRSRRPNLPATAPRQGVEYDLACQSFLAHLDPDHLGREAMAQTLSNPMELTLVAQMLAEGQQPNLLNLQQQQYDTMARRYEHIHLRQPFPLAEFGEMAYQMRLADQFIIPAEPWFKELSSMEPYRMVLRRQLTDTQGGTLTEWRFRHEKIQDFFIVQTFWGQGNERPAQHLGDPRFRGVYLLLATQLPLDNALQLREILIDHAVQTKDHSVSDRFIELIQARSHP